MALDVDAERRARRWASTMAGVAADGGLVVAHRDGPAPTVAPRPALTREQREAWEDAVLVPGATRCRGGGERAVAEAADPLRTAFERDRDRILHAAAFRRLAGKTQVFVFPRDRQRTRLTHSLEVAQVATAVARATGLNLALVEAIALGHDCGHGPGGHASEAAFDQFVPGGYDHAVWGADVVLAGLNLTVQTLDGVRNHSWSRPAPATPEGALVSWADRIAYSAHDLDDAMHAGIVSAADLPGDLVETIGADRPAQIATFVQALVAGVTATGTVGMPAAQAGALAELRRFNYERIYTRPESVAQGRSVAAVLCALVEHYAGHPYAGPDRDRAGLAPGSDEALRAAVAYVAGMTDRFAFSTAVAELDWDPARLPRGVDSPRRG